MTEVAAGQEATAPDGTCLYIESHGRGEPVLLIQGLGYATWAWRPQIEGLRGRCRVVAFDNRGAGRSDKPAGPYSIRLLAEDALAVLDQMFARPAHVVGASMGGYVALTLAARHPDAVRSLVLISTSAGGEGSAGVPRETLAAWQQASSMAAADFARRTMPLSFSPGWSDRHPEDFDALLRDRLQYPTPPEAWRAQFAASESFLRDGLGAARIRHPALVIHGTEDRVVPYANAGPLVDRLADASLLTLPGAGHLCWIECADVVNARIAAFVEGVRT